MPPALPPRDLSRPDDPPSTPAPLVPHGGRATEVDCLRATVARLGEELAGLKQAMASRAVIDQAKGAVRAVAGLSGDEAFALLAGRSQNTNRKLSAVAAEVFASLDAPDRTVALLAALHLPDPRLPAPAAPDGVPWNDEQGWRSRRRLDPVSAGATDRAQLLAVADLAELLAGAADRDGVVDVLVRDGADAVGAFGAGVASVSGHGATVRVEGLALVETVVPELPLDAVHPAAECLRSGRNLVLSRPELALTYPDHPLPPQLRGVAVLPLARDTVEPAAWTLYFDHPLAADRSTRALLDRATRVASRALSRAV